MKEDHPIIFIKLQSYGQSDSFLKNIIMDKALLPRNIKDYKKDYSEEKFWEKLKKNAKKAGFKVVYAALMLFYAFRESDIPLRDRALTLGALGYFILPFDLIPDFLVGGYIDDLWTLLFVANKISKNINEETREKARQTLRHYFKDVPDEYLKI